MSRADLVCGICELKTLVQVSEFVFMQIQVFLIY
jgi:transcription elongation factor Elf1